MFCKHKWSVLSETYTKSAFDEITAYGLSSLKGGNAELFSRKFIQIVQCDRCGSLKRFVEDI